MRTPQRLARCKLGSCISRTDFAIGILPEAGSADNVAFVRHRVNREGDAKNYHPRAFRQPI